MCKRVFFATCKRALFTTFIAFLTALAFTGPAVSEPEGFGYEMSQWR